MVPGFALRSARASFTVRGSSPKERLNAVAPGLMQLKPSNWGWGNSRSSAWLHRFRQRKAMQRGLSPRDGEDQALDWRPSDAIKAVHDLMIRRIASHFRSANASGPGRGLPCARRSLDAAIKTVKVEAATVLLQPLLRPRHKLVNLLPAKRIEELMPRAYASTAVLWSGHRLLYSRAVRC